MKVYRVRVAASGSVLFADEAPKPQPGRDEVLVRVCAAGITPTELNWYPTTHNKTGDSRVGAVPVHEFSGVIEQTGEGVEPLETGREVIGMNDWFADGALAEYCIAPFHSVAPKPGKLSHAEAATVPISALTSWQALYERAGLRSGERVLIHGAAGSVGIFGVQLARLRGAYVFGTASADHHSSVTSLGAQEVIDYRLERFEDRVGKVDVVLDTVGGETLRRSLDVLTPGGRVITIASSEEQSSEPRLRDAFFIVEPNHRQLSQIGNLLEEGQLRTLVRSIVPFDKAPDAFRPETGPHGPGKVVVTIENR